MSVAAELRPRSVEDCAAALAEASRERRTVRIRGAGTKSYLGDLVPTDVTLETGSLAGIGDHVPADLTVTVGAGTRLADVQRALGEHGQHLPIDPPHALAATVGGIVAANSNGFGRLRYGGIRDLLIGTTVVLADGTTARPGGRVVKNVAGYDLNKLLIGSLGTLGLIVEATLKILPLPPARGVARAVCRSGADAFAIADALVRTPLRPSALVVERGAGGWTVVVAAHGERAQVDRTLTEIRNAARARGAAVEETEDEGVLLSPLRELPATATDGALVRAALPLAAQRSFLESAEQLDAFGRAVADAGAGIVRVHLRGEDAAVVRAADALLAAAGAVGGSAHVERRQASLRDRLRAWPAARPGGDFLMRRTKDAFDPAGILEPGRSIVG